MGQRELLELHMELDELLAEIADDIGNLAAAERQAALDRVCEAFKELAVVLRQTAWLSE